MTAQKSVVKLEGLDSRGYFIWRNLNSAVKSVEIHTQNSETFIRFGVESNAPGFMAELDKKWLRVNGYFFHFGKGAYDWIYLTRDKKYLVKLEGLDSEGYFVWTCIEKWVSYQFNMHKLSVRDQ